MLATSGITLCLQGNVYDDELGETAQTVLVVNGRIERMWNGIVPASELPPDTVVLTLTDDEVLFPGFINLHVHTGYNVFPLWDSPSREWKNRYQWRANNQYKLEIKGLGAHLKKEWRHDPEGVAPMVESLLSLSDSLDGSPEGLLRPPLTEVQKVHAIIAELQAVAGGTCLTEQTVDLETEEPDERSFIIRNTANPADLGLGPRRLISVVDFYEPRQSPPPAETKPIITGEPDQDTSTWYPGPYDVRSFVEDVQAGNPDRSATLAHLAEGRSGFLHAEGPDPYTRREFTTFVQQAKNAPLNADSLTQAHLLLTHATGVDFNDPAALQFVRDHHISIVWSPVSNLLLYSDTLPVHLLHEAGINICLGSDWSPSGSKHVWDELKFAKHFNDQRGLGLSAVDLYRMVTVNPARGLGNLPAGRIRTDYNADFFVLRKQQAEQAALEALFTCDDSRVRYVIVNGRVVYGDEEVFEQLLQVDYQRLPATEGAFAAGKAVSINANLQFDLAKSLQVMDLLVEGYVNTHLTKPLRRPRFLSADDLPYQQRIARLKERVSQL